MKNLLIISGFVISSALSFLVGKATFEQTAQEKLLAAFVIDAVRVEDPAIVNPTAVKMYHEVQDVIENSENPRNCKRILNTIAQDANEQGLAMADIILDRQMNELLHEECK